MDKKEFVLNFIKSQSLAVIATVNKDGKPEDAVIGFGETDDFELVFGTSNTSRKYSNIKTNPNVAFVIGWNENKTVQYEGIAAEVTGEEAEKYKLAYHTKTPSAKRFESLPEQRYFKVTPKRVRYTDLNHEPWEIIELKF